MKKNYFLFLGVLFSICFYVFSFIEMPMINYDNLKDNKANNFEYESNVTLDFNKIKLINHYKLSDEDLKKYNEKDIINFGRLNPMQYTKMINITLGDLQNPNNSNFDEGTNAFLYRFANNGKLPVGEKYYKVTSEYGYRNDPFTGEREFHHGIDIAQNNDFEMNIMMGKPVYSVLNGEIIFAGTNGDYGNLVIIDHGDGFETFYGHLNAIGVNEGQNVTPGQFLGTVGITGRTTGPHLHFEVRKENSTIDPKPFMDLLLSKTEDSNLENIGPKNDNELEFIDSYYITLDNKILKMRNEALTLERAIENYKKENDNKQPWSYMVDKSDLEKTVANYLTEKKITVYAFNKALISKNLIKSSDIDVSQYVFDEDGTVYSTVSYTDSKQNTYIGNLTVRTIQDVLYITSDGKGLILGDSETLKYFLPETTGYKEIKAKLDENLKLSKDDKKYDDIVAFVSEKKAIDEGYKISENLTKKHLDNKNKAAIKANVDSKLYILPNGLGYEYFEETLFFTTEQEAFYKGYHLYEEKEYLKDGQGTIKGDPETKKYYLPDSKGYAFIKDPVYFSSETSAKNSEYEKVTDVMVRADYDTKIYHVLGDKNYYEITSYEILTESEAKTKGYTKSSETKK